MDFISPVGRIVQGAVNMRQEKDSKTNQLLFDKNGEPVMSVFLALAYPKVFENGQRNTEFDEFFKVLAASAVAAWPQFFPQGGPAYVEYVKAGQPGAATHAGFSWKYQDGDGVDTAGQSVAGKAGFAGHHIVKFSTAFPVRCFYDGKFAAHEEIQKPEEVIKPGYWIQIIGETKSNNADLSLRQVPGIAIYPKLIAFVARGEEIVSGPNAEEAFGKRTVGWRPPASASAIPSPGGAPPAVAVPAVTVPTPAAAVPPAVTVPAVTVPSVTVPTPAAAVPAAVPAGPVVSAAMAAAGITWPMLQAEGWTEVAARAAGHIV